MNENKGARVLNRIFHICFFACMAITFVGALFYGYSKATKNFRDANGELQSRRIMYGTKVHVMIYMAAVLMLVFFVVMYYLSKKDYHRLRTAVKLSAEVKFRIILFSVLGVMLAIQLYFGWKMKITPAFDLRHVSYNAASFGKTGSFDTAKKFIETGHNYYMARYPNNFAIMMILALLYRAWFLMFGTIPLYAPVVMNCLAITSSLLFTVLIAKQMWGRRKAVYTLFLLFIFAPFYVYVPFYYTDTLSMPFGMLGLYLFLLGLKKGNDHKIKKYLMLAIAGALLFIGFKVKGSIGVIFAATLVYSLLKCKLKEFACVALALILGFGSFAVMFKVGYNAVGLVTEEQADKYEYPLTHWVMMGLKGKGGYNNADSMFTDAIDGKENKREANIEVIKERLSKQIGNHTLMKHFAIKAIWMWSDGTYFIPGHIKTYIKRSFLHEFFLRDGKYYYMYFGYSNAFQLVLLLMMAMSLLKGVIRPKIDFMVVVKGSVFALFLFLLIWEGRSRYLYNMTPLYLLMAVDGISFTAELLGGIKEKFRKKSAVGEEEDTADPQPTNEEIITAEA